MIRLYDTIKKVGTTGGISLYSDEQRQTFDKVDRYNKLIEESWKIEEEAKTQIKKETSWQSVLKGTIGLGEPGLGAVGKIGKAIGGYGKAVATHPKEVAKGVFETGVLKPIEFAQRVLQPSVQQKPTEEIIGKPKDEESEKARQVGEFLGWLVPYSAISKGVSVGLKALTKAPKILKYIPAISDTIGFIGTGQILYEKGENATRLKQARNDLIALGIFKGAAKGFQLLKRPTAKEVNKTITIATNEFKNLLKETQEKTLTDIQVGRKAKIDLRVRPKEGELIFDIKKPITAIEKKVAEVNKIIKKETGSTPKELLQKEIGGKVAPTITKETPIISKALEPLAQEARKYIGKDRLTGKKFNLFKEINKKPKFKKTDDIDFNDYANEFYRDFDQKIKPQLLKSAKKEFPNLDIVDVDMSGSFKKGTPNVNSDLDAKIYYTNNIKESVLAEDMKTLWSSYGLHDTHFQRVTQAIKGVEKIVPKAKPKPVKITGQARPKEVVSPKPAIPKGKPSGVALSIEAKAIEKGLTEKFKDLAEYTPTTIKKQAVKMEALMKDIEKAKRVVRGHEPLPEGLRGSVVVETMERYALKTKDGELMAELAKSPLATGISESGQELGLLSQREKESAIRKIKEVITAREKGVERRLKYTKPDKIKSDMRKALDRQINKTKPTKYSWTTLMSEIQC